VLRAQLEGERAAERRAVERIERERRARAARIAALERQAQADAELEPLAARFCGALEALGATLTERLAALEAELAADSAAGEELAGALRACAHEESGLQARLREHADAVTTAEVAAQQARDHEAETATELAATAERLGLEAIAADAELAGDERVALRDRIERLGRRREALGPVNPLAAEEYREALERVEELETQRADLETALREHVGRQIGKLARPGRIIWADDLPKTRSGKIMRRLLRDIADGRELGDVTTLRDASVVTQLQQSAASGGAS